MTATRDPNLLEPFWAIVNMPRWDHGSPEWQSFVADIQANGIRHPIQITKDNVVVDGETRRQAALELGLTEVPVVIVDEGEIYESVLREIRRRHLTPSATAYVVFPMFKDAYAEAISKGHQNRLSNLRKRENPNVSPTADESAVEKTRVEDIAKSVGVCEDLFRQAARLHEIFTLDPSYRLRVEPGILAGEVALGAAIAGYAGRAATAGQARPETRYFGLIKKSCAGWSKWPKYWLNLQGEERQEAVTIVRQSIAGMPTELRDVIAAELRTLGHR